MPQKQPKRRRLWLSDGSCVRLRPAYPDHVWSYDFMYGRAHDGRAFRLLTIIDEHSRVCLPQLVDDLILWCISVVATLPPSVVHQR